MKNVICDEIGQCQDFCGMCHVGKHRIKDDSRRITKESLFGSCRTLYGECVCGLCKTIVNTHYRGVKSD